MSRTHVRLRVRTGEFGVIDPHARDRQDDMPAGPRIGTGSWSGAGTLVPGREGRTPLTEALEPRHAGHMSTDSSPAVANHLGRDTTGRGAAMPSALRDRARTTRCAAAPDTAGME